MIDCFFGDALGVLSCQFWSSVLPFGARLPIYAHRYTYAPPRCRTSQYHKTFISLSVSLWNDLSDPVFDGV